MIRLLHRLVRDIHPRLIRIRECRLNSGLFEAEVEHALGERRRYRGVYGRQRAIWRDLGTGQVSEFMHLWLDSQAKMLMERQEDPTRYLAVPGLEIWECGKEAHG